MNNHAHKVKYVQGYILLMKHVRVQIRLPNSDREAHLLNHAYTLAVKKMNELGQTLNV